MLKRVLNGLLALAFTAGISYAAVYTLNFGRLQPSVGTAPVFSLCGATTAGDTGSSDTAGTVTTGAITSCTLTFGTAFAATPSCVVNDLTANRSTMAITPAASKIDITGLTASDKLSWVCMAKAGG